MHSFIESCAVRPERIKYRIQNSESSKKNAGKTEDERKWSGGDVGVGGE